MFLYWKGDLKKEILIFHKEKKKKNNQKLNICEGTF